MAIIFKLTNAGRQALINAAKDGTQARRIVSVGVTATAFTPTATIAAVPGEIKRITTIAGDVVAADTIHVTIRDDGNSEYTVRGLGLYLDNGVLLGTYSQAAIILEKSPASIFLLATDVRVLDGSVDISTLQFGETNFINPPATTERQGVVQLATKAIAEALSDATRALTAASVKALFEARAMVNHIHDVATQVADGFMSKVDKKKLDGIAENANNYALPTASPTVLGGLKLGHATVQAVAASNPTATDARTYPVQVDSSGRAVVNVPWANTNTTYGTVTQTVNGLMIAADKKKLDGIAESANNYALPAATSAVLGGIKLGHATVQTVAAGNPTATAARSYPVQVTSSGQAVVNVPWADTNTTYGNVTQTVSGLMIAADKKKLDGIDESANNYALPAATAAALGGIKLGHATVQTVAAANPTATAARTYPVQVTSSGQAVVNVPWADTNTTYGAASTTVAGLVELATDVEAVTGSDAQRAATPSGVDAAITAKTLGIGQVWVNMLPSRAVGTNYTNTTGRPIAIFVGFSGVNPTAIINVNGVRVAFGHNDGATTSAGTSAVIPKGATYSVDPSSTLTHWSELR